MNLDSKSQLIEANKLINEASNRLITWAFAVIGGSILAIISTEYVNPKGFIVYAYSLFGIGWVYLGLSIYYGEKITRIYIAGITLQDSKDLQTNGHEADKNFSKQISYFKYGILVFSAWLFSFLIWFIVNKN